MPGLRPLTLIVLGADRERLDGAIAIACASAALGSATTLYLHDPAVRLAAEPLFDDALSLGVRVIACQTGLAAAGLDHSSLDQRIEAGGLVSLLAQLHDARLLTV